MCEFERTWPRGETFECSLGRKARKTYNRSEFKRLRNIFSRILDPILYNVLSSLRCGRDYIFFLFFFAIVCRRLCFCCCSSFKVELRGSFAVWQLMTERNHEHWIRVVLNGNATWFEFINRSHVFSDQGGVEARGVTVKSCRRGIKGCRDVDAALLTIHACLPFWPFTLLPLCLHTELR